MNNDWANDRLLKFMLGIVQHEHLGVAAKHLNISASNLSDAGKKFRDYSGLRLYWETSFSAPKSVSLTALVGGDFRVREAHREAVTAALDALEGYTQGRIGGNHPPETTGQFVTAKFEHDTARPVDGYVAPELHTHTVIFNATVRTNSENRL